MKTDTKITQDLFGYKYDICHECDGTGEKPNTEDTCDECDGSGEITVKLFIEIR
jgi:DnaJ-class molecular chaperone